MSSKADEIQGMIVGYLARRWMQENSFLPELSDLTTVDDDGKPTIDLVEAQDAHVQALMRSTLKLLNKTRPVVDAATKDVDAITGGDGLKEPDNGFGGGGGFDSGGGFGGDMGGGGMDMGMGAMPDMEMPAMPDMGGDEAPAEDDAGAAPPDLGSIQ